MQVEIEERFPRTGFVYVGDTRIVFAPKYIIDHAEQTEANSVVQLGTGTGGWAEPTSTERTHALSALVKRYGAAQHRRTR